MSFGSGYGVEFRGFVTDPSFAGMTGWEEPRAKAKGKRLPMEEIPPSSGLQAGRTKKKSKGKGGINTYKFAS